jgi:hypothetical protein
MQALPPLWRLVHWVIIINFLVQIAYGTWMVFFVVTGGGIGPLFGDATGLPFEEMMVRRQYALETWVAIGGLSIYLAVTEVLPRRLRRDPPDSDG